MELITASENVKLLTSDIRFRPKCTSVKTRILFIEIVS